MQRIDVVVDEKLRFSPSVIHATSGWLEIKVTDRGATPHTFMIPSMGVIQDLSGAKTRVMSVNFGKPGSYAFNCMFHAGGGMAGAIEIS